MLKERIDKIKELASKDGAVINLKDGTKIYCESIFITMKFLKSRMFKDASYVEYPESTEENK